MLRTLWLTLLLAPISLLSGEEPLRLGLVMALPDGVSTTVFSEFRAEMQRLIEMPGVHVVWQRLEESDGTQAFDRLVVIRMLGECQTGRAPRADVDSPLGVTHISDGRVLPFAEVDCGRVLSTLSSPTMAPVLPISGYAIGRALARVGAHELYHVLTESPEHSDHGIAKPSLSPSDLRTPDHSFSAASLQRLRESLFTRSKTTISAVINAPR